MQLSLPTGIPIPFVQIPLHLRIQILGAEAGAGFPSPTQDWDERSITLVKLLRLDCAASFVFHVSGQSMSGAGIQDPDMVIADSDATPSEGRIVIAVVEGGFVVRQLAYRGGMPVLEARNSRMRCEAIVADESVEVWGVVRASVRNLQG